MRIAEGGVDACIRNTGALQASSYFTEDFVRLPKTSSLLKGYTFLE